MWSEFKGRTYSNGEENWTRISVLHLLLLIHIDSFHLLCDGEKPKCHSKLSFPPFSHSFLALEIIRLEKPEGA